MSEFLISPRLVVTKFLIHGQLVGGTNQILPYFIPEVQVNRQLVYA